MNWFTVLVGATLGVLASAALAVVAEGPDPVVAVLAAPFVLDKRPRTLLPRWTLLPVAEASHGQA